MSKKFEMNNIDVQKFVERSTNARAMCIWSPKKTTTSTSKAN